MTDNEIIKALEHCRDNGCAGCPLEFMEDDKGCIAEVINLINRQKAEIERLEDLVYHAENEAANDRDLYKEEIDRFKKHIVFEIESAYDRGKKAAVKDFAERLKKAKYIAKDNKEGKLHLLIELDEFDDLVKEMVGEEK